MEYNLPSLSVTFAGSMRRIPRVIHCMNVVDQSPAEDDSALEPGDVALQESDTGEGILDQSDEHASLYRMKKVIQHRAWADIRDSLRDCVVRENCLPDDAICSICLIGEANIRCQKCSPYIYCSSCFKSTHTDKNFFHIAERWENGMFQPALDLMKWTINCIKPHFCATQKFVAITCIDELGFEHNISFKSCSCENLALTLVRARLWPATPTNPRLVFAFDLLDWAEALLLECQTSLKDFCMSLYYRCPFNTLKRRDIYESLIDSFEEYRFMKHQLRYPKFLCNELDIGNVCPACSKEPSGNIILSTDALFGLPRKLSAGVKLRDSLFENIYFLPQEETDAFVSVHSSTQKISKSKECNSFLAGDPIRTRTMFKALDETAVFGCSCRHEFPILFTNLKHGERLSYSIHIMEKLTDKYGAEKHFLFMYDIACSLVKNLKNNQQFNYLTSFTFAIPIFHSYGHIPECQFNYSPLRINNIGLTDGEVMERLWSFLRRFARMTKEMRPEHRIDILTSALLYYGYKTKNRLVKLLLSRWKRMNEIMEQSSLTLSTLTSQYNVTSEEVSKWIEYKVAEPSNDLDEVHVQITRDEYTDYFLVLQKYYGIIEENKGNSPSESLNELLCLNQKLESLEVKLNISRRWTRSDSDYLIHLKKLSALRMKNSKSSLFSAVSRRQFLLNSKMKYADGHKIAKKLSRQITKATKDVNRVLAEYNKAYLSMNSDVQPIQFCDIISTDLPFWNDIYDGTVPSQVRHNIVNSSLLKIRAEEEHLLLQKEMQNVIQYYDNTIQVLTTHIAENNEINRGALNILKQYLQEITKLRDSANAAFSDIANHAADTDDSDDDFEGEEYDGDDDNVDAYDDLYF